MDFTRAFKISGRYWLNNNFNYENYNNNNNIFKYIYNDSNNVITVLYKIKKDNILLLKEFLYENIDNMKNCIGYEVLFANFVKTLTNNIIINIVFEQNNIRYFLLVLYCYTIHVYITYFLYHDH